MLSHSRRMAHFKNLHTKDQIKYCTLIATVSIYQFYCSTNIMHIIRMEQDGLPRADGQRPTNQANIVRTRVRQTARKSTAGQPPFNMRDEFFKIKRCILDSQSDLENQIETLQEDLGDMKGQVASLAKDVLALGKTAETIKEQLEIVMEALNVQSDQGIMRELRPKEETSQ